MTKAKKAVKAKKAPLPLMKRGEAKSRYLAMGEGRSLERLCRAIRDDPAWKAPDLNTLKTWSRTEKWVAAAKEHDAQVAAAASTKAIEQESGQRVDLARKLRQYSTQGIDRALAALAHVNITGVSDLETLVKSAVDASKQAEVLDAGTGGPGLGNTEDDALAAARDGGEQFFAHIVKLTGARAVH